ncbi:MAG: phosphoglucosamine mutase [Candidatus Neomarinimicrobiota bacterium]
MLIRSISGVRGLVASHLKPDTVRLYARVVNSMLPDGEIALGRDSRPSGEQLSAAIAEELAALGRRVVDCGIVPTPTVQFIVERSPAVGGIVVTASHNPIEWNGLKFVRGDGTFFHPQQCQQLFETVDGGCATIHIAAAGRCEVRNDAIQRHVEHILGLDCIDTAAIRERQFKIAVDAVNGAGAVALPLLLEKLGCTVVPLYCTPSGEFLRGTEPLPENLRELGNAVTENAAAAGFAVDPDADRLAVVSEKGIPLGEENTLVLAVDGYWRTTGKAEPIVVNLSTTMALEKLAQRYGTKVVRSAVGEINVVQMMQTLGAPLGGEGNGGVILAAAHLGRDSLVGAAMVLNRMAQSDQPLSAIAASLPQFVIVKDKVSLEGVDVEKSLATVQAALADAEVNTVDGVKFTWPDRWVHLRKSNTEPIMRIYAEAETAAKAHDLVSRIKALI